MGRRTFDVVSGFDGWPYGELPVHVATHRPMAAPPSTVSPVEGDIVTLVETARKVAAPRDVYLDGGALIRQALDRGLIDELTVALIPMVLGHGQPLFAGTEGRHPLERVHVETLDKGLVKVTYRPKSGSKRPD